MAFNAAAYSSRISPVHRIDARVKVVLLVAYSATLLLVGTWMGMLLCLLAIAAVSTVARIKLAAALRQLAPLAVILLFTLGANCLSLSPSGAAQGAGPGSVSLGLLEGAPCLHLAGSVYFDPAGFERGCFYVLRIVLLLAASLVLTTTSSPTELARALRRLLKPLARLGLRVDDISMVVSIALRFIPEITEEYRTVKAAQLSRGAKFYEGGLTARLRAWSSVLVPLFVGLFRRADRLSLAMDARCYGTCEPGRLEEAGMTRPSESVLVAGLAMCACLSWLL